MKIILSGIVKGEQGENLPETSLQYESGGVTVVPVETAARPTVLALIATGRMAPDAGAVTLIDEYAFEGTDREAMTRLRAATAIVDAPDVSEPVGDLKFRAVVQEELMFAGRPSNRRATDEALEELGVSEFGAWEVQNVPTATRLRVLAELAASRPGVEALVLTAPDRRGSDPFEWWQIAADLASRGLAVLVIASPASVDLLAETTARFEADRVADVERRAALARAAEDARRAELAATPAPATIAAPAPAPAPAEPKSGSRFPVQNRPDTPEIDSTIVTAAGAGGAHPRHVAGETAGTSAPTPASISPTSAPTPASTSDTRASNASTSNADTPTSNAGTSNTPTSNTSTSNSTPTTKEQA